MKHLCSYQYFCFYVVHVYAHVYQVRIKNKACVYECGCGILIAIGPISSYRMVLLGVAL